MYDLAHVSWVGSALYRSCTASQHLTAGQGLDDLDRDLFYV